jgi:hypothetical protein
MEVLSGRKPRQTQASHVCLSVWIAGIHRVTVTALLERHEVELRRSGLVPEVIPIVARMYSQGWSCARLGELFGVDPSTVWRALRVAGVKMRPSSSRVRR